METFSRPDQELDSKVNMLTTRVSSLLFLLSTYFFTPALLADDTLSPTQHLDDDGGSLISDGSRFELGFFSPVGSSNRYIGIWYHNISVQTVVWVANRQHPISDRSGRLSMMANGTLILTDNSTVVWSTSSPARANPVAQLLNDGNFVVMEKGTVDDSGSFSWESFNFPTDTLLPGMKLGWDLTSGTNRNLTAWSSPSDPSPSNYVTSIDRDGDPQLFTRFGGRQYWRGGPWNGIRFSGIPQMKLNIMKPEFVENSNEITFFYNERDPSIIQRVVTNYSGAVQDVMWIEESKSWSIMGFAPRDECDGVSPCGPNGVCNANGAPICACMRGFRPKNNRSWDVGDWTEGCVRKTSLDCSNRTDGFLKQSGTKLPDTSRSTVDRSMSLEQCEALCLRNCSCEAYARANISGSGSGCIIWTTDLTDLRLYGSDLGQDLYVRLAASDLETESEDHHRGRVAAIILVTAVMAISLVGCAGACWVCRRKLKNRYKNQDDIENIDMDLPIYDLATIVNATGNFSVHNKLGEGGFGPVYRGQLRDEKQIAVKRLSKTSRQGVDEFKNEVNLMAKLQHRNLVRLLGCCIEGGERMLIYEYMPNGSLDAFLFDETKSSSLDWAMRYNIILGISRGLLYLHQDSRLRIIHRDLKVANILLDEDMNPRISDFGMARIFGGEESEGNTRRVVGTYGYMSPEYAMEGIFSVKSDVFSLGVLILEIISGKRNRGSFLNLLEMVWNIWKEGKVLELVDRSMGHSFHTAEVLSCIKIGLLCVQEHPTNRPTVSSIVKMLGSDSSLLPEPKQPGFIASASSPVELNPSTPNNKSSSVNSISTTMLEGR